MKEAKKEILALGYEFMYKDEKELQFKFKDSVIRYYPDSEGHSGKSITDGRGLYKLLTQLVEKSE